MEILQHSLKKVDLDSLSAFQLKVWGILRLLFKNLIVDQLSSESAIEKGLGIDVFLRLIRSDFVIYMSITEDYFYINSKYFDIYIYPEIEIDKIELLLRQVLLGKYSIKLGYGRKDKLVYKELVFGDKRLEEFNDSQKIGFLTTKIENEKRVEGVKLIND
ncbi:MAG: hypothetical protein OEW75_07035 [Cyclobacteriaceae bacterium]|nr:hypothetical protein [Cyclobacteriaceae bacterium]